MSPACAGKIPGQNSLVIPFAIWPNRKGLSPLPGELKQPNLRDVRVDGAEIGIDQDEIAVPGYQLPYLIHKITAQVTTQHVATRVAADVYRKLLRQMRVALEQVQVFPPPGKNMGDAADGLRRQVHTMVNRRGWVHQGFFFPARDLMAEGMRSSLNIDPLRLRMLLAR